MHRDDDAAHPAEAAPGDETRIRRALLHMLEDLQRERDLVAQGRRDWLDTVDSIRDPLLVHDAAGRIVRANKAYAELADAAFAQLIGRPYWEFFPRRDAPLPGCLDARCAATKGPVEEFELTGGEVYASRSYAAHPGADAGPCALHLFENVTQRRRDERRLQARHQRRLAHADALNAIATSAALRDGEVGALAREVVDRAAPACGARRASVWLHNAAHRRLGCIARCDPAARQANVAPPLRRERFPCDAAPAGAALDASIVLGGRQLGVLRIEHAQPQHRWEDDEVAFAGQAAAQLALALSNRDARRAERARQASERRLRTIFEHSPVGLTDSTLDGRYLSVNPRMCAITGYSEAELQARSFRDITHAQDIAGDEAGLAQLLAGQLAVYATTKRYLRKDGQTIWVALRVMPVRSEDGEMRHLITAVEDITARRLAEQRLARTTRALKTLSTCNEALVRATGEDQLLHDICRLIVQAGGYRMAWVGFAEHDAEHSVAVAAQFGADPDYFAQADIGWADDERGHGPAGTAIRERTLQVVTDTGTDARFAPWRAQAIRRGYASSLALPLLSQGKSFGALCIHAGQRDAFDPEEIALLGELANDLAFGILNLRLRAEHELAAQRLQASMEATVRSIAATVEMRDPYTAGHQNRVAELAAAIAREMGLDADQVHGIHLAGVVHDVGKIRIPAELLSKPTRLSAIEFEILQTHAEAGHDILKDVDFPWPIADIVWQHHERLDGSGYPRGLRGSEIVIGARILAVADTTEAMSSNRPYRPGLGIDAALAEITAQRGRQFDADVVDACLRVVREGGFRFAA